MSFPVEEAYIVRAENRGAIEAPTDANFKLETTPTGHRLTIINRPICAIDIQQDGKCNLIFDYGISYLTMSRDDGFKNIRIEAGSVVWDI